ncbi:phosphoribosylamine--glycine ligase [Frigoriflavimonas asaccharolytica]|uniref:Phosphoribosylamine--glycine ligase n=1 Tax=Frigoriflavimonas asaccharolytica TaxID=2735899 RepID=A0A8J8KAU2_9FLAO|nr:phosphoribosylamine--glycine ligase [Frigoriflavimonas asaccharolytica]NRS91834.1 phosphoribosylamine--glycine ligase [Frigoriflavimonas asaccharolytica]
MRVLIIGNGGREAAFGKKLAQDKRITEIFFAKGNAATENIGTNIYITEISELLHFAKREAIDLTIVGPEAPLVDGIVDEFKKAGLRIFGPEKKVAKLEGSKAYAKNFMKEFGVKTARSMVFNSFVEAKEYLQKESYPLVIKASGLAQGKGVVIAEDFDEALKTIHDFMIEKIYGDAGIQVVIEEFLKGFEVSIIAVSNGKDIFPMISAKDYKKVGNGGIGANTGGMGSLAPSPDFTLIHNRDFLDNILKPTLEGLKDNYLMFTGFMFFGLLVTENGCHLLEYNMRSGDPETQVLMELLDNELADVIEDCIDGREINLKFKDEKAVCLVLASGGYPGHYETGYEITGLEKVQHSSVFLSGATNKAGKNFTAGGRVLNIIATGKTFDEAREKVYADALPVKFDYAFYRNDIAKF